MGFGAVLKNKDGMEILGDHEDAYLYWGKVSIGLNSPEVDLLGIPNDVPIITFHCNTAGATCTHDSKKSAECYFVMPPGSHGKRRIWSRTNNNDVPYSGGFDVYVFAKTEYVPLPTYGMALYDKNGKVIFHTGRPPLRISAFQSGPNARYGFKAAIPAHHYGRTTNNISGGAIVRNSGWSTSYRRGGEYHVSRNQTRHHVSIFPPPPPGGVAPPFTPTDFIHSDGFIPVIDGGFYDKYSNL